MNLQQPILRRGNAAEVFANVLLSQIPDRDLPSVAVDNSNAKELLWEENSLGMMAKRPVAKIGEERLRFIKPVVNPKIVLRFAAELPRAALGVLKWMSHRATPRAYLSCNLQSGRCAQP